MKLAGVISFTLVVAGLANCGRTEASRSTLVSGLENLELDEAREELDRRLTERFAAETTEAMLKRRLKADGLNVGQSAPFCDVPRCASIQHRPDRLGGVAWTVVWSDRNGQVSDIRTGRVMLLN